MILASGSPLTLVLTLVRGCGLSDTCGGATHWACTRARLVRAAGLAAARLVLADRSCRLRRPVSGLHRPCRARSGWWRRFTLSRASSIRNCGSAASCACWRRVSRIAAAGVSRARCCMPPHRSGCRCIGRWASPPTACLAPPWCMPGSWAGPRTGFGMAADSRQRHAAADAGAADVSVCRRRFRAAHRHAAGGAGVWRVAVWPRLGWRVNHKTVFSVLVLADLCGPAAGARPLWLAWHGARCGCCTPAPACCSWPMWVHALSWKSSWAARHEVSCWC